MEVNGAVAAYLCCLMLALIVISAIGQFRLKNKGE